MGTDQDTTVNRWEHVRLVPKLLVQVEQVRQAFEEAEKRNALVAALAEGCEVPPGAEVDVKWDPLTDVEVELLSRLDRDAVEWREQPLEAIEAEEAVRREWHRGCQNLRVSFPIITGAEAPTLIELDARAHAILAGQGVETIAMVRDATPVCGGALRRHSFPPRDAAWLRDGVIREATCQDCRATVTRDELVERAEREQRYGTCHVDGDAFELRGTNGSGLVCPTCTAVLRDRAGL